MSFANNYDSLEQNSEAVVCPLCGIYYFIYYFSINYSVLAQLGFGLAWLGWAVTIHTSGI